MDATRFSFLAEIVGDDGARALRKAAERSATLEAAIMPRAILSWVEAIGRIGYEGQIPGAGGVMKLVKGERGVSGELAIGGKPYRFQEAPPIHVAAALAVALGVNREHVGEVRNGDLAKLGKSIDLLVKARVVNALRRSEPCTYCSDAAVGIDEDRDPTCGASSCSEVAGPLSRVRQITEADDDEDGDEEISKVEEPGAPAKPQGPVPPAIPTKVAPPLAGAKPAKAATAARSAGGGGIPSSRPKMAKTLKVTKAQAARACPACGVGQFYDSAFTGCYCFSALAKSVKATPVTSGGYSLELNAVDWGGDEILTLLESLGTP